MTHRGTAPTEISPKYSVLVQRSNNTRTQEHIRKKKVLDVNKERALSLQFNDKLNFEKWYNLK